MKKVTIGLVMALLATSLLAVACDKENDVRPVAAQETTPVSMKGTSWIYHHEGTVEYGGVLYCHGN